MRHFRILTAGSICLVAAMAADVPAEETTKPDRLAKVIDGYIAHLKADKTLPEDVRKAALVKAEELRKSDETRDFAITDSLRELSPVFKKALAALGAEDFKTATPLLTELTKSKNPYMQAQSRYFLARSAMLQEKYEQALPHLQALNGDLVAQSTHPGEVMFLTGMAQLHVLKRKEAAKTLADFLKNYPDAPERLRVAAWRQLELLQTITVGSLADIHQHMELSRRRLNLKHSGDKTQETQKKIVAMLDKMIKEAEKNQGKSGQCACKGGGNKKPGAAKGNGAGQGQGSKKGQGDPTGGQGTVTRKDNKTPRGTNQRSPWDHLRKTKRDDKVFSAVKSKFPARYQKLMEQYFRSLKDNNKTE